MAQLVKFKILSLGITEERFVALPFGRQIEYNRKIEEFKNSAKRTHLSQKRKSYKKAISEFCKLNNVKEYYCRFSADELYYDDSFEFFWR